MLHHSAPYVGNAGITFFVERVLLFIKHFDQQFVRRMRFSSESFHLAIQQMLGMLARKCYNILHPMLGQHLLLNECFAFHQTSWPTILLDG